MNQDHQNSNIDFLLAFSTNLSDPYAVAIGYFVAVYCHSYIRKNHCDFLEPFRNDIIYSFLSNCNLPHHLPTEYRWDWAIVDFVDDNYHLSDVHRKMEESFYALNTDNLNAQIFFSSVGHTFIVQNWAAFNSFFAAKKNPEFFKSLAIAVCLRIYDTFPDYEHSYSSVSNEFNYALSTIGVRSEQDFLNLMNSVFFTEIKNIPVSVNGQIKQVKKLYSKYYVTYNQLLEDYAAVVLHTPDKYVLNPWLNHSKQFGHDIEVGVSVAETLYNMGAYKLKQENATDLIKSVFYATPSRNDSAFEIGFLAPFFYNALKEASKNETLIINPSPDFIIHWEQNFSDVQASYAVPNKVIADLYNYQFRTRRFFPFSELRRPPDNFSSVLLMSRDWNNIDELLPDYTSLFPEAVIYAVLPNSWLDGDIDDINKKNSVFDNITIHELVLIDNAATNSTPRKKGLFVLERFPACPNHFLQIRTSTYDSSNHRFYIEKKASSITQAEFVNSTLSLVNIKRKLDAPVNSGHYETAQVYHFSQEIQVHYSVLPGRKNRFAGMADFRQILDSKQQKSKISGKRLSERIEKGLRAKTEASVVHQIETCVPYDERVEPYIISEIFRVYGNQMSTLSLKTLWFVLRSFLKAKKNYDDELCKKMFDPELSELHRIQITTARLEDYEAAIGSLTDADNLTNALPYWRQLHILLSQIVEQGYYNANPISEKINVLNKSASIEQQEVRNALTKKTFTELEEQKIYSYLMEEASHGIKHTSIDSLRLASGIRFYTGMDLREICALTWNDFQQIQGTDNYQLIIAKFVDENGNITTDCRNQEKKFRRIPLAPTASMMLLERQEYLLNSDAEQHLAASNMPIILSKATSTCKGKQPAFCKPAKAANKCKELVAAAGISERILILPDENGKEIVTDIYKYYGDIFKSNFKYRANHTCKLRRGEINYILGIEAPDTFSGHYCDYLNDSVQSGMAEKLNRWETIHHSWPQEMTPRKKRYSLLEKPFSESIGPYYSGNSCDTLTIEIENDQEAKIQIDVVCKHGIQCDITHYPTSGV